MILIVTTSDDLHAQVIRGRILEMGYKKCQILCCDQIANQHLLSLTITNGNVNGHISVDGNIISMTEVRVLWLRRMRANQNLDSEHLSQDAVELINNDCRAGLLGLLASSFHGKWVSTPESTSLASDKVFQLTVARLCNFRIPNTLVTQHKSEVIDFHSRHHVGVIVKTLAGINEAFLQTRYLNDPNRLPDEAFSATPAIYQEYIPGSRHIRLNCFGNQSFAGLIESHELDWRPNLQVPIVAWPVPALLHTNVRAVLDHLGLEMGVIDLKQTPDGEFVWLEVNPQGQFLFLDAITQLDLASKFSEYLINMAK